MESIPRKSTPVSIPQTSFTPIAKSNVAAGATALELVREAFQTPCCKSELAHFVLDAIMENFDALWDDQSVCHAIIIYIESKTADAGLGCFASPSHEEIQNALNDLNARLIHSQPHYHPFRLKNFEVRDAALEYNQKPIVRNQDNSLTGPFNSLPLDLHYPITRNLSLMDQIRFSLTNKCNFIMNCADVRFWKSTLKIIPTTEQYQASKWLFLMNRNARLEQHVWYGKQGEQHLVEQLFVSDNLPPFEQFAGTQKPQILNENIRSTQEDQTPGPTPLALILQKIQNNKMTLNEAKNEVSHLCYWLQFEKMGHYGNHSFKHVYGLFEIMIFVRLYYQGKLKVGDLKDSANAIAIQLVLRHEWTRKNFEAGNITLDQLRQLPPAAGTDALVNDVTQYLMNTNRIGIADFFAQTPITYNVLSCDDFLYCLANSEIDIDDVLKSSDKVKKALINPLVIKGFENQKITITQVTQASDDVLNLLDEKNGVETFIDALSGKHPSTLPD